MTESKTKTSACTEAYLLAQMERAKAQSNNLAYKMLAQRLTMAKVKLLCSSDW